MPVDSPEPKPNKRRSPRIYKNRRGVLRRDELFEIIQCSMPADGWKDLTIRQIARGAGVSLGLIHHHFATRDDIARSFYEEVYANLGSYVANEARAPFAKLFREFMEYSLEQHAFIGSAYADTLRLSFRTKTPLPSLWFVFANMLRKATDVRETALSWLLEVAHRQLVERYMHEGDRTAALARSDAVAATCAALVADLGEHASSGSTQIAGTEWHDSDVQRSLILGIPSRNPRRIRDARRRSGKGA